MLCSLPTPSGVPSGLKAPSASSTMHLLAAPSPMPLDSSAKPDATSALVAVLLPKASRGSVEAGAD